MFACCQLGGIYINEDGSVDMKRYFSCVRIGVNCLIDDIEKSNPTGSKKKGISEITFNPLKICHCPCHQDGKQVMH